MFVQIIGYYILIIVFFYIVSHLNSKMIFLLYDLKLV